MPCLLNSPLTGETLSAFDINIINHKSELSDTTSDGVTKSTSADSSKQMMEEIGDFLYGGIPIKDLVNKPIPSGVMLDLAYKDLLNSLQNATDPNIIRQLKHLKAQYERYKDGMLQTEGNVIIRENIVMFPVDQTGDAIDVQNVRSSGGFYTPDGNISMSLTSMFYPMTREYKHLNKSAREVYRAHILLHELTHYNLFNVTRQHGKYPELREYFEDLLEVARENSNMFAGNNYGLSNVDEFIAESFSNPDFRETLDKIEYTPKVSILDAILRWLSDIFLWSPEEIKTLLDGVDIINYEAIGARQNPTYNIHKEEMRLIESGTEVKATYVPGFSVVVYNLDLSLDAYADARDLEVPSSKRLLNELLNIEGVFNLDETTEDLPTRMLAVDNPIEDRKPKEEAAPEEPTEEPTSEEAPTEPKAKIMNLEDLDLGRNEWVKEDDQYVIRDGDGNVKEAVPSVTSRKNDGGIGRFSSKGLRIAREATQIAQDYWGNRDPEEAYHTNLSTKPVTMEEYAELVEKHQKLGMVKGNIIHKLFQRAVSKNQAEKDVLTAELELLYTESGYKKSYFQWVIKHMPTLLGPTMMGLNIKTTYNTDGSVKSFESPADEKIYPEVAFVNEILKLGGTIDSLIRYDDGTWSIKDIKTSSTLRHFINAALMKYGNQGLGEEFITQSSLHQAKLQVMLYAFLLKASNPHMRFRNLAVLWLPREEILYDQSKGRQSINPAPYLNMIRQLMETEYAKEMEELKSRIGERAYNDLFNEREYDNGINRRMRKELDDKKISTEEALKRKMLQLQHYIAYDMNPLAFKSDRNKNLMASRAEELVKDILELQSKMTDLKLTDTQWKADISWLSLWLNSPSMVNSPYIQLYNKLLKGAKANFNQEYSRKWLRFKSLLLPLVNEYLIKTGKKPIKELTRNWVNMIDTRALYAPMIMAVTKPGEDNKASDYKYRVTDAEWAAAKQEFKNISEKEWKMYRNLANYVMDTMDEFFVDTASETALANQIAAYQGFDHDGQPRRPMTHLELQTQKGEPWKYFRGFMAKVPADLDELGNVFTSKRYRKEMWFRIATLRVETQFDMQDRDDIALPIKYLGNTKMNGDPFAFSWNVEKQFDLMTRNMLFKKHMDPVYAMSQGLKLYLKNEDEEFYSHTIKYLNYSPELHLRGRNQVSKGMRNFKQKSPTTLDIPKFVSSLRNFAVSPIMWFNFQGGTANGIFGMLYLHKESIKNSIMKGVPIIGADKDVVDFSFKDLMGAQKDVMTMYKRSMFGNIHKDKTYIMLNKFGYLPDTWDVATRRESLLTSRNTLFSQSSAYLFYSLPEEMIAALTMVAQLKSMKIRSNDDFNGTSFWDMYTEVTKKDENGNEYVDYEWATDPKTNKPYVRGYKKVVVDANDPKRNEYYEISDLTDDEVSRLYFVYERMQGGYRKEERALLEYFFVGQIFMQLRRYLPNILRNAMMSAGPRSTMGKFKRVEEEMRDGKPVVQWVSEVMEGRWSVFLNVMFNAVIPSAWRKAREGKDPSERGAMEEFIYKYIRTRGAEQTYNWDNLSTQQKEAVIDASLTGLLFFGMSGIHYMIFGGEIDEDDPWNRFMTRIMRDFSQQYNIPEIGKNITTLNPIALKKMYDFIVHGGAVTQSLFMYLLGDEEKALTKEGVLRGWNQWQRDIPLVSAIRRWVSDVERLDPDWSSRSWYGSNHNTMMQRVYGN